MSQLPPSDDAADHLPEFSRRGLLVAGAALLIAGCGGRTQGVDPLTGVPMRPGAGGGTPGIGDSGPTQPMTPQPPDTIPGRGYTLVPRRAWTDAPVKSNNVPMGTVTRITVHHTGEHAGLVGLPDKEVISRIESYHRNDKKWAAIGYHFLVGRDGKIYEGRPAQYQGAHTSTQNENNLGVSVIGDFMTRLPNPKQLSALKAFLDDKREKYGVGKGRIYGHRDLHASLCPGDALYGWVKSYRA